MSFIRIRRCLYCVLVIVISLGWCGIAASDTVHKEKTIKGDEHWYSSQNVHIVEGNQYIEGSLTIHAGCYIEFYDGRTIKVKDGGSLYIDGDPGNWVTMVGREDPVTHKHALWEGITVDVNAATINRLDAEQCSIWDAKKGFYMPPKLGWVTAGNINLTECYVYYHTDDKKVDEGIYISGLNGSVNIIDSYVCWRNSHGIRLQKISGGSAQVYNSSVANCDKHGIFTESCSNATISNNYVQWCDDGIHAWDVPPGYTYVSYNDIYNCNKGIWRGRGSATTYNNEIYNCSEGIYTDDHSGYIDTNYIYVPSGGKGIHVYKANSVLYGNYITWYQSDTNGAYGIYTGVVNDCWPSVSNNEIYHVNTGIYCGSKVQNDTSFRSNKIQHCSTAIHTNGSAPDFGTEANPGNHNIDNITSLFFKAENAPQKVMAQMNWWGSEDPDPNMFWWNGEEVVYKPCLQAPPP